MLADVTPSMRIFAEEICGPVVRVTPFDTEEEAVSLASARKHAPAAYIWTADLRRARRLAPAIQSQATWVSSPNARDLQMPSGGAGRADGHASIDFYTQSRTVHLAADKRSGATVRDSMSVTWLPAWLRSDIARGSTELGSGGSRGTRSPH